MKCEQALKELLQWMPPDGTIQWDRIPDSNSKSNSAFLTRIRIPPCAFMHIYTPNDKRIVSITKRSFWDDKCSQYVARAKWCDYLIETNLNKTLPRDFKWLSERKY